MPSIDLQGQISPTRQAGRAPLESVQSDRNTKRSAGLKLALEHIFSALLVLLLHEICCLLL